MIELYNDDCLRVLPSIEKDLKYFEIAKKN